MSVAHPRGTSNTNTRGNTKQRLERRGFLLGHHGWGNGWELAKCVYCGTYLGAGINVLPLSIDRVIPGTLGGTYAKGNIRPACLHCNSIEGNRLRDLLRNGVDFFSRTFPARPIDYVPRRGHLSGGQLILLQGLLEDGRMTKTRIALEVGCSAATVGRIAKKGS